MVPVLNMFLALTSQSQDYSGLPIRQSGAKYKRKERDKEREREIERERRKSNIKTIELSR